MYFKTFVLPLLLQWQFEFKFVLELDWLNIWFYFWTEHFPQFFQSNFKIYFQFTISDLNCSYKYSMVMNLIVFIIAETCFEKSVWSYVICDNLVTKWRSVLMALIVYTRICFYSDIIFVLSDIAPIFLIPFFLIQFCSDWLIKFSIRTSDNLKHPFPN